MARAALARLTLLGAAAAMVGCSSLNIDVDVYKGPLVSQKDVQKGQLVAMAMSAKTLMLTMRNNMLDVSCPNWSNTGGIEKREAVLPDSDWEVASGKSDKLPGLKGCTVEQVKAHWDDLRRARRLNDILSAYEKCDGADRPTPTKADKLTSQLVQVSTQGCDDGRTTAGIGSLATDYAQARAEAIKAQQAAKPGQETREDAASARALSQLLHALVDLAGRMQILATNLWLIDGNIGKELSPDDAGTPAGYGSQAPSSYRSLTSAQKNKALLESIANNIIVHTDDLRRQEEHDADLRKAARAERLSADTAFAVDAEGNLRNIEQALADGRVAAEKREADDLKTAAAGGVLANLEADIKRAEAALTQANNDLKAVKTREAQLAWLALTVGAGNPPGGVPVPTADAKEAWRTDQADLAKALKVGDSDKVEVEQIRQAAAVWVAEQLKAYSSAAGKDALRGRRLEAAAAALEALKPSETATPNPMVRSAAWTKLKSMLNEALVGANARGVELSAGVKTKTNDVAVANGRKVAELNRVAQAARGENRRPSADFVATQRAVSEVKQQVLSSLRAAGQMQQAAVMTKLREAIGAQVTDKSPPEVLKENANIKAVLDETIVSPRLVAGPTTESGLDVIDGVITQLRYRYIDSVNNFGNGDARAARAREALEQAQAQRNDMIYLRPASSYLRSVYAATVTQADSAATQWQNMLAEGNVVVRTIKNIKDRGELDAVRGDLDKAYWQNINSVKVAAAGSSNFVVAKDDVGNWYVKAMGSDPGAMIRAAKNLALYNAGAGLNTDLLRVSELRARIDGEENADKRGEMRSELNNLTGSSGGPTVAERSRTVTLFRKNYGDLSEAQRDKLSTRLSTQELPSAIKARWEITLADANADARKSLQQVLNWQAPQNKALDEKYQAALDAVAADPPGTTGAATGKPVGSKIVEALRQVQAWRAALKAAVAAADGLVATEQGKLANQAVLVNSDQQKLAALVTARDAKATRLAEVEAERSKVDRAALTVEQANKLDTAWDTARQDYATLVSQVTSAGAALDTSTKLLAAAQKDLTAAKARQVAAAKDVDDVVKAAVDEVVAQRLQVVRDTETAVGIVGRSSP